MDSKETRTEGCDRRVADVNLEFWKCFLVLGLIVQKLNVQDPHDLSFKVSGSQLLSIAGRIDCPCIVGCRYECCCPASSSEGSSYPWPGGGGGKGGPLDGAGDSDGLGGGAGGVDEY